MSVLFVKQPSQAVPIKHCEAKYFPVMITANNGTS